MTVATAPMSKNNDFPAPYDDQRADMSLSTAFTKTLPSIFPKPETLMVGNISMAVQTDTGA